MAGASVVPAAREEREAALVKRAVVVTADEVEELIIEYLRSKGFSFLEKPEVFVTGEGFKVKLGGLGVEFIVNIP